MLQWCPKRHQNTTRPWKKLTVSVWKDHSLYCMPEWVRARLFLWHAHTCSFQRPKSSTGDPTMKTGSSSEPHCVRWAPNLCDLWEQQALLTAEASFVFSQVLSSFQIGLTGVSVAKKLTFGRGYSSRSQYTDTTFSIILSSKWEQRGRKGRTLMGTYISKGLLGRGNLFIIVWIKNRWS